MVVQPTRARRNLKANTGRIIRVEQLVGRLEKRIERLERQNAAVKARVAKKSASTAEQRITQLEKENASLKSEIVKLRASVERNQKESKQHASAISRLDAFREPVRALVRSFKQTPDSPFPAWRMWMLSTFRKQGVYRRQMFK